MTSKSIVTRFAELGVEIPEESVENRIKTLTDQFKVPVDDAENSVISYFLRDTGVERSDYYTGSGGNKTVSIKDLPQDDGKWVNLRVKLVDVWDNQSEHMSQVGLIADDTGKTKFVLWRNAGLANMVLGKSYSLENVVTSLYNDRVSITLNKTSVITEIVEGIEVDCIMSGVIVDIKDGSGLIKRCPECNRALKSGTCPEHGNIDGVYDLRILGVLDDGVSTRDVVFNLVVTESIWGHTLSDATSLAMDALDADVVIADMRCDIVGKYYKVVGVAMDATIIVNECEAI